MDDRVPAHGAGLESGGNVTDLLFLISASAESLNVEGLGVAEPGSEDEATLRAVRGDLLTSLATGLDEIRATLSLQQQEDGDSDGDGDFNFDEEEEAVARSGRCEERERQARRRQGRRTKCERTQRKRGKGVSSEKRRT